MDSVIKVEKLSKKFRLRTLQAGGGTLRDVLANALKLGGKNKYESGRTILFVSHNAAALQRLCKTGIYLERGGLKNYGAMRSILAEYQTDVDAGSELNRVERADANAVPEGEARFIEWRLIDSSTEQPRTIYSRENCRLEFTLVSKRKLPEVNFRITLRDGRENPVVIAYSQSGGAREMDLLPGTYQITWEFDLPAKAETYSLTAEVFSRRTKEQIFETWKAAPPLVVCRFWNTNWAKTVREF